MNHGKIISEFVRLRSKMYSYIMENGKGGMTAKGITKNVIKKKTQCMKTIKKH